MHAVVARSHWSCFERFAIALFSATAAPVPVTTKHFHAQRRPIPGKISACQDNSLYQKEGSFSKSKIGGKSTLGPSQYLFLSIASVAGCLDNKAWDERAMARVKKIIGQRVDLCPSLLFKIDAATQPQVARSGGSGTGGTAFGRSRITGPRGQVERRAMARVESRLRRTGPAKRDCLFRSRLGHGGQRRGCGRASLCYQFQCAGQTQWIPRLDQAGPRGVRA